MIAETVLDRLQGVRRNGNGWIALCPAHADRSPSLSIRQEKTRVLLHCFAGCFVEEVCTALGLKVHDLFTTSRAEHRASPPNARSAQEQIASIRSRLTPRDRNRSLSIVLTDSETADLAFARALALAVEGELVQVAFKTVAE